MKRELKSIRAQNVKVEFNKPNAITMNAIQDVEKGRVLKSKSTKDLFKKLGVNIKDA